MQTKFDRIRSAGAVVLALSLFASHAHAASAALPFGMVGSMPARQTADIADIMTGDVILAQHRKPRKDRGHRGRNTRRAGPVDVDRPNRRHHEVRPRHRHARDSDQRRYMRGHRGYPERRQGYRRSDDGWWYPLAAFALGAVILNQYGDNHQPAQNYTQPSYSNWDHIPAGNMVAHDNWCDQRYRSYSRANKTFQPYNGPRRYCNSPYDRI